MPRPLPALSTEFKVSCLRLLELSRRLELNFKTVKHGNSAISLPNLEMAYELVFLKAFLAWEDFQEQIFLRLLCGYAGLQGREPLLPGLTYFGSVQLAHQAVLNGRDFVLWHNRDGVVRRFDQFFANVASPFRAALATSPRLLAYSALRHRIAHIQDHAKAEFDVATNLLSGKRYRGARAGKFLRDQDMTLPDRPRYISRIFADLGGVADRLN